MTMMQFPCLHVSRLRPAIAARRTLVMFALTAVLVWGNPDAAMAQTNPCQGLGVTQVSLTPVIPLNFSPVTQQIGADCLAWQEFIYLNWQADPNNPGNPDKNAPPSAFGTPGDTTNTVWQSYLNAQTVFNPTPNAVLAWNAPRPATLSLARTSKVGATSIQVNDIAEASGGWLTSQRGGLTYYQVLMNQDEYQFITTNVFNNSDLTTYAGQLACASNAGANGVGGFNLPAGGAIGNIDTDCTGKPAVYGQNIGAIEIKAAWVALPADGSLNYRYKSAVAELTDPYGNTTQATVGLVGLHIIHKYPGAAQLVWATFEQIDNSPDDNNGGTPTWPALPANANQQSSPGYTFFNPVCTTGSDPVYQCQRNLQPTKPCPVTPTPGCQPYTAPMQVTRITPVESVANSVTGYVWGLLPAASVFNYYRLIDVQWPNSPSAVPPQSTTPLTGGDVQPPDNVRIMANTSLETFVQTFLSCMDCHQNAPIAQQPSASAALSATPGRPTRRVVTLPFRSKPAAAAAAAPNPYASDYSFIFSTETNR
jgi:hypothetical protein